MLLFTLFNVAIGKFKIKTFVQIVFPLDSADLEDINLSYRSIRKNNLILKFDKRLECTPQKKEHPNDQ